MADDLSKIGHYKTAYICGVFDLFHAGHLNILRRCKEHCDYLIVGVDSDDLTECYKSKRPAISQEDRMEIVKAIRYVDEVVLVDFHNHSPRLAWDLYRFDVQFCGDDHQGKLDEEKRFLQEHGSDLIFLPYTKRISSTMIKKKIEAVNV